MTFCDSTVYNKVTRKIVFRSPSRAECLEYIANLENPEEWEIGIYRWKL